MRIQFNRQRGSIIAMMLILTVLIGLTLGSYLHLVSNQNLSIMRSMAWNQAVAVAEAGIEEAMAHLNANTTNRARDGWVVDGTNVVKEKTIGTEKYKTYISAHADPPTVISEGWVLNPKDGEFFSQPRVVRVMTTNDALFAKGMVAKGQIDLKGNNIMTDSFDSSDPNHHTGGRYDLAKRKDNGDIATNSSVIDSLNVWNAEIYGRASTGPGGNVSLGANGSIGSIAWHDAGYSGPQPGWTSDDMNVQFPEVKHPYAATAVTPIAVTQLSPAWTINSVSYDYVLMNGNYEIGTLNLKNKKMLVMGDATLLVTGDIAASGNGGITIETNASLNLYMAGASADLGGNGILNKNGNANAFGYWGLKSNTSVNLKGNAEFTGTIYAPEADLTLGGGGTSLYDFVGASVSNSVTMDGHYKFHYDESLGKFGPKRGYTIVSWNETDWSKI